MAGERDDVLSTYIERALSLRERGQDQLSAEQLREVALELGLTEADLAQAEAEAENHLVRGQQFLGHGRFDDAVKELREALVLRPGHLETASTLAWAHRRSWGQSGREESRAAAEALARRCLELDPRHSSSIELLNDLDRPRATRRALPTGLVIGLVLAAVAFLGLTGGLGAILLWSSREAELPQPPPIVVPALPPALPPPALPAPAAPPMTSAPAINQASAPRRVDVSPELALPEDVTLQIKRSLVNNYRERSYYKVNGLLKNNGRQVLTDARLRVEVFDGSGAVLTSRDHRFWQDLRPGGTWPVHVTLQTDARAQKARLSLREVQRSPAPAAFPPSSPLELGWIVPQPAGVEVTIAQRDIRWTDIASGTGGYHRAILEVSARSSRPLKRLELQLQRLGAGGVALSVDRVLVTDTLSPPLYPGEVRVLESLAKVPGPVARYTLAVTRVELDEGSP